VIKFYTEKFLKTKINNFLVLIALIAIAVLFYKKVDLEPKISANFFFSNDSKIFKEVSQVNKEFPSGEQIIIGVPAKDITSSYYVEKIRNLTNDLQNIKNIDAALSITKGPEDIEAALNNPLWKRVVVSKNHDASFIICFLNKNSDYEKVIFDVEKITQKYRKQSLDVKISGMPYIVDQMRKNISQDMKNYTLIAIFLCSLTLLIIYRSFLIVIASLICCSICSIASLLILSLMGHQIGILTANLIVIIYVLAQSHLIFLTSNFQQLANTKNQLSATLSKTLPSSFWCMITTLLGFLSLILVTAKPIKELGIGGSIGTICAFVLIYLTYPTFLKFIKAKKSKDNNKFLEKIYSNKKINKFIIILILSSSILLGFLGIPSLDTDPNLLKYFKKDGKIANQIEFIDKNGGSNPLKIIISNKNGERLDNDYSYEKMWNLQKNLAKHKEVGSIISLPVIMAEADENWLGKLLPWEIIIDVLFKDKYQQIGRSFISKNKKEAMFFLRMKEAEKSQNRLKTISQLKQIVSKTGFKVNHVSGTYYLQARLGASVKSSIINGVASLIAVFLLIILIISTSIKLVFVVAISIISICAIIFGSLGILKIPIDIISSPAINISLGIAVDSIIHITRNAKSFGKLTSENWTKSLKNQAKPAIISITTVIVGFSTFALSSFPPSQRFGIVVVFGSVLAAIFALIIIPTLSAKREKTKIILR
jgi:predicted RND superfamily exporter protein